MSQPFITVLSYSGGVQSTHELERVFRGEVERPERFLVLNSNPGMEDQRSYASVRHYRARCLSEGIDFITADGPDLYRDILNLRCNGNRRIDNPPYWTRKPDGTAGMLKQGCTQVYKIAAMRRALRRYLESRFNLDYTRPGLVEMWIGFSFDEKHRCSKSDVQYIRLRFPLVEDEITKAGCLENFKRWGVEPPPRSVCVACFANGLAHFREMYYERPDDWEKAVEIDNAVEQWNCLGITEQEVFVSRSLIRLRDMPAMSFGAGVPELQEMRCNSGACFI